MLIENVLRNITLDLHGRRQDVVLNGERFRSQIHFLDFFETGEFVLLSQRVEVLDDGIMQLWFFKVRDDVSLVLFHNAELLGKLLARTKLGHDDGYEPTLKRVTVNKDLGRVGRLNVNVLELLWRNIFTLRKLENVFRTINNLDGTVGQDHADITRCEPSVFIESLGSLLGVLEVALEDRVTLEADFASWILIGRQVLHLRDVPEPDSQARERTTDMTRLRVVSAGDGTGG